MLWLALFGLMGVFSRYGIDRLAQGLGWELPIHTLIINVLGSALAGILYAWAIERSDSPLGPELRTALMVGFLGGFTTFSAYALQAIRLFEDGRAIPALLYTCVSPALGLLAAWAGLNFTRFLLSGSGSS
jgi:CrcB protein